MNPGKHNLVLAVTGGRDFANRAFVHGVLDRVHHARTVALLVFGDATGVDQFAWDWAHSRGVPHERYEADWKTHGNAAGPIRNGVMLRDEPWRDGLIAFPGGKGTADCKRQAAELGIPVWEPAKV